MKTILPSEIQSYLKKRLKFTDVQVRWVADRYDQILAGEVEDFYLTFFIEDRNKRRLIEAPCKELKGIQKKILTRFLYRFKTSDHAHGFVKDRSPKTNANAHLEHLNRLKNKRDWCALMIDVKDFFHNIKASSIWKLFLHICQKRAGGETFRVLLSDLLTALCVKDDRLPMGAPTSPALSNLFMFGFDNRISKICKRRSRLYTRYADDIVVSGPRANDSFKILEAMLREHGLRVNAKKTRVCRLHKAVEVTGVTVNSGQMTVTRKYRRKLRAALHQTKLALEGAESDKTLRTEKVSHLIGQAGWCSSVNGRHSLLLAQAREVARLKEEG